MENLRAIRKRKGLSQVQLADLSEVTQGTISKIEAGDKNVTLDVIRKIASALDVHPVELFKIETLEQRVIAAINAMDPARRDAALTVLETMAAPK